MRLRAVVKKGHCPEKFTGSACYSMAGSTPRTWRGSGILLAILRMASQSTKRVSPSIQPQDAAARQASATSSFRREHGGQREWRTDEHTLPTHTCTPTSHTHTREQAVLLLLTRVDGDPLTTDLFSNFIYASVNPGRWGVNISQSKLSGKNCTLYFIHLKQNWLIEWHGKKYVILHLRA